MKCNADLAVKCLNTHTIDRGKGFPISYSTSLQYNNFEAQQISVPQHISPLRDCLQMLSC